MEEGIWQFAICKKLNNKMTFNDHIMTINDPPLLKLQTSSD
jgi:hypothetical protein